MNKDFSSAIHINIETLASILEKATQEAKEAAAYIKDGERNMAIGGMVGIEPLLLDAQALQRVIFALHRQR